jgi:hypothetical protein
MGSVTSPNRQGGHRPIQEGDLRPRAQRWDRQAVARGHKAAGGGRELLKIFGLKRFFIGSKATGDQPPRRTHRRRTSWHYRDQRCTLLEREDHERTTALCDQHGQAGHRPDRMIYPPECTSRHDEMRGYVPGRLGVRPTPAIAERCHVELDLGHPARGSTRRTARRRRNFARLCEEARTATEITAQVNGSTVSWGDQSGTFQLPGRRGFRNSPAT